MAWKTLEYTLTDSNLFEHDALKELNSIEALIDWSRVEHKLSGIYSKPKGERAWPPLMMFKSLLLQHWYVLSDPALEKQLARDLLFRRFVGLPLSEGVPDHSTLWRFKQQLRKQNLIDVLFDEINQQLTEKGILIKLGSVSIIDASVIEAKQCRPKKNKAGKETQDPDASWNVKTASNGKKTSTYGYKVHANVDEDGLVKKTTFSTGSTHDSKCFIELLEGDESSVYADSAYPSKEHNDYLEAHHIKNRMIRRAYRNRPLTKEDKQFNKMHSGVRSTVERVFGVLKQHYGMRKARYLGLERNQAWFKLMCIAHNIKRGLSIQQESCA